jgi:hypothetical protein
MKAPFLSALSLIVPSLAFAQGLGWPEFVASVAQPNHVVFVGENSHSLDENKRQFLALVEAIRATHKPAAIALEYVEADVNQKLQSYLRDPAASAGSDAEAAYFQKLHHRYPSMTTPAYDDFFRGLRKAFLAAEGTLSFCGIDLTKIDERRGPEELARKRAYLKSLPAPLIAEIEKIEGRPIEEVAAIRKNWDREAGLAVNLQSCASDDRPVFVLIGSGHAVAVPKAYPWRTTRQLARLLFPERKTLGLKMMLFPKGSDRFADEKLFSAHLGLPAPAIFSRESLPPAVLEKMANGSHGMRELEPNYANLFDFFLFGPPLAP